MATSAGWDGTLNAIFDDTDCKLPDSEIGETGEKTVSVAAVRQGRHQTNNSLILQAIVEILPVASATWFYTLSLVF